MLDFVALQVEYHKAVDKAWGDLIPRLQAVDVSEVTATGQSRPSKEVKASKVSSSHQANSHSSPPSSYNNDPPMAESTLVGV